MVMNLGHFMNNDFKGMTGTKFDTGNQLIDQIELLCCKRAGGSLWS